MFMCLTRRSPIILLIFPVILALSNCFLMENLKLFFLLSYLVPMHFQTRSSNRVHVICMIPQMHPQAWIGFRFGTTHT